MLAWATIYPQHPWSHLVGIINVLLQLRHQQLILVLTLSLLRWLVVEVERHVGDYVRSGFRPHTARVYIGRVISGQERLSSETLDLSWFPIGDIPEGLLPWYRQPIEDGLERKPSPANRSEHQGLASIWSAMKIDLRMRWQGR